MTQDFGGDINGDRLKNDRGLADAITPGQLIGDGDQQHKKEKLGQHRSGKPERCRVQQRDIDGQDRQDVRQQDDAGHQKHIGHNGDEGLGVGH